MIESDIFGTLCSEIFWCITSRPHGQLLGIRLSSASPRPPCNATVLVSVWSSPTEKPKHTKAHILDVVCSRIADRALLDVELVDPGLSDHLAVCFRVNVRKPLPPKKTITYRNLRNINIADFTGDLRRRLDGHNVSADDLDAAVCRLDTGLSETLDHHAPKKQRTVRIRSTAPWLNSEIIDARKNERRLERKYRKFKLDVDKQLWENRTVDKLFQSAKLAHFSTAVSAASNYEIFHVVNS